MWEVVALTSTCLLPFSYILGTRKGYVKGYIRGGKHVLREWEQFNQEMGNRDD